MSSRYKWFSLGIPNGFQSIAPSLRAEYFAEASNSGFSIGIDSSERLEGEFLSRSDLRILRSYIDGEPHYETVTAMSSCGFCLFPQDGKIWLRITDPPRSTRALIDALERITGMGFFAVPVVFSESVFNRILKTVDECRLISAKGIAALPSDNALARIEVASKDGLILSKVGILKGVEYVVDSAVFEILYRRERGQISFARSGLVRIGGQLSMHVLKLVERSLGTESTSDR